MIERTTLWAAAVLLSTAAALQAQDGVAHWDFEGDLTATTAGHGPLSAEAAQPAAQPSVTFEDATIDGRSATVAHFTRGTYFRLRPGFGPNGGGRYLNEFTLILDVMFPDRSPSGGWAALYQTNTNNANDGDWFVDPDGGVGISGVYDGIVPEGEWRRLALVVDLSEGRYTSFVDGEEVQELGGQTLDGRFSLYTVNDGASEGILLFADDDGDNAAGFIDAAQIRDRALCREDIAALGSIADGPLTPVEIPGKICAPDPPDVGSLAIKEGPYLQWGTESGMTVMWETTIPADSTVFFRRAGGGWEESSGSGSRRIHEIRLGGFDASEVVEYYVRSRQGDAEVLSDVSTLETAPAEPVSFAFTLWGDSQDNPAVFGALVGQMIADLPKLVLSVGDVVGTGSIYEQWGEQLFTPIQPLARSVPFYVAIGNHEQDSHWFYDYMSQPGNEHWFSFDYAGCHFVIIDTNYPFGPGSEQYRWLEEDLFSDAAQDSRWLLTFHHHPPYSEIYEEVIYAQVRQHLVPLFEASGVDANFTGHIHDYERGIWVPPDTGRRIAYVQTSGGGGRLWDDEFGGEWDQIEKVIQYVYHYCVIDVNANTLDFRAVSLAGEVIDSFTLHQLPRMGEPPPPPPPPPESGLALTQWDFEHGDLRATFGPGTMEYLDGESGETAARTRFGTTSFFGIADLGGEVAHVLQFPKALSNSIGFQIEPDAPPNAGGGFVNEFTLVVDLHVPSVSFALDSWLGIFNTNASNSNDGDLFIDLASRGIGISGQYDGEVRPDTWHRVAAVFASDGGEIELRKYVDGTLVGTQSLGALDGRWSLYSNLAATPWFHFLTDDSGETTSGYVSSFLFVDRAVAASEISALGGPDADGILDGPCFPGAECRPAFRRGDGNDDGTLDVGDAVFALFHLFAGRDADCEKALDADDDGELGLSDPITLLDYLFLGGDAIQAPFPVCSVDPTEDELECEAYRSCEG